LLGIGTQQTREVRASWIFQKRGTFFSEL